MKKVRIKEWTELEKISIYTGEAGDLVLYTDEYNDLVLPNTIWFTQDMEFKLPLNRIIEITDDFIGIDLMEGYSFTEDMIAEYIEETSEISEPEVEQPLDIFKDDTFAINLEMLDCLPHKTNHIHYLKWKLTDNLSVRYFYNFETKPELIGKFTLKNHKHKQVVEISEETAKEMIKCFCVENFEEIIGFQLKKVGYKKYIKKFGEDFQEFFNV